MNSAPYPFFRFSRSRFLKNILKIANDFPGSKFRSRDRARARPLALRGIPRVAVWGLALGPASSSSAPRCSGATFRWSDGSLGSSSSAAGCNMVQISEDFRTLNLVVTATAPARATRDPAYGRPGRGDRPQAAPDGPWSPRFDLCGPEDLLGQVQSLWRSREAIKKYPIL